MARKQLDFAGFILSEIEVTTPADFAAARDDFCAAHGYEDEIEDGEGGLIPNPETKRAFLNRKTQNFITDSIKGERKRRAELAAAWVDFEIE